MNSKVYENGSSSLEADRLEREIQSIRLHVGELAHEVSRRYRVLSRQRAGVLRLVKIGAGILAGLVILRSVTRSRALHYRKIIVIGDDILWKRLTKGNKGLE